MGQYPELPQDMVAIWPHQVNSVWHQGSRAVLVYLVQKLFCRAADWIELFGLLFWQSIYERVDEYKVTFSLFPTCPPFSHAFYEVICSETSLHRSIEICINHFTCCRVGDLESTNGVGWWRRNRPLRTPSCSMSAGNLANPANIDSIRYPCIRSLWRKIIPTGKVREFGFAIKITTFVTPVNLYKLHWTIQLFNYSTIQKTNLLTPFKRRKCIFPIHTVGLLSWYHSGG